jgi:GNAT superfamily N-acetyltransferase
MMSGDFIIEDVTEANQEQAKKIILDGLAERFGFLDTTLNPDLNNIVANYSHVGNTFVVGLWSGTPVCTGALIREGETTARIARMSVAKGLRRRGFAKRILEELVDRARRSGYTRLVLETNRSWYDAISFYKSNGFVEYDLDDSRISMEFYPLVNFTK